MSRLCSLIVVVALIVASPTHAQWSGDFGVTSNPALSRTEVDGGRNVAVSGDNVGVVWFDTRDGNAEIYFREKIGAAWGASMRLTSDAALSIHPAIGRFGSEIRVVWEDHRSGHPEIWTKRRLLGSWTADSCLTCDEFDSARPSLDHTGENLAWEETKDGNREIYHLRRRQSGMFEPEFRVSSDSAESNHPSVASSHHIEFPGIEPWLTIVAWQDSRHGNLEIYSRFAQEGPGWGAETRVTSDGAQSRYPSVAVELAACGDLAFVANWVAWQDDRHGNEEIYFAEGSSGFWNAGGRLTNTALPSQYPSIIRAHSVITTPFGTGHCPAPAFVWEERASGTSGSIQFLDLSMGFPAIPISDVGADAYHASIAARYVFGSPGILTQTFEVVWTDRRDLNEEIYHAQGVMEIDATDVPEVSAGPADFRVSAARPNPFAGTTEISVTLERGSDLSVTVVDSAGRIVRRLFDGMKAPGRYGFGWDGRGPEGHASASGVYFLRVRGGEEAITRSVVLLR